MGNVHLVTGYKGEAHITAADQGAFNAAVFGSGQYVLECGNQLSASATSSNNVRVLDGEIMMQGRHIRINPDEYVDLTISNGAQGAYRNDLIVARYTKNTSTGVESCDLVVIEGTASTSSASDPAYTAGDILSGNTLQNDMPLYRVSLDGITIDSVTALFETVGGIGSVGKDITADQLPVVPIVKGGTNATTADKACENLGAVKKSGDTMTGTLTAPKYIVQAATNPAFEIYNTSGNRLGYFNYVTNQNRLCLFQNEAGNNYGEGFLFPFVETGKTASSWYVILTSKDVPAYVNETGSSNGWTYKKYSDGTVDLWHRQTVSPMTTSASGYGYKTGEITLGELPFTVNEPVKSMHFTPSTNYVAWPVETSSGTVELHRHSSGSVAGVLCVTIHGTY